MGADTGSAVGAGLDDDARLKVDGVLEHFGIPGMRWGRRRSKNEIAADRTQVEVKVKAGKGVVKTSGGKDRMASDDAIVAKSHKQVARASTTDALSNKELQELVTRMNLEQQYSRLAGPAPRSMRARGAAFFSRHLADDAVNAPIGELISAVPRTAGQRRNYDRVVTGAKILNPLLNPPTKK